MGVVHRPGHSATSRPPLRRSRPSRRETCCARLPPSTSSIAEVVRPLVLADLVDRHDARVVEVGGRLGFGPIHRTRDASKIALVHLVARLKAGGFRLLDTQFVTDHLKTFGAVEVPRRQYHKLLEAALAGEGDFGALGTKRPVTGAEAFAHLTVD